MDSKANTYKGSSKRKQAVCAGISATLKTSQKLTQSNSAPIAMSHVGNVKVEHLVMNASKRLPKEV